MMPESVQCWERGHYCVYGFRECVCVSRERHISRKRL